MSGVYDIYVVAHVEGLKADRDRLEERVRELVHENAELSMLLDRAGRTTGQGPAIQAAADRR